MELDSIECVSSIDGTDEDEIHHHNLHHKNLHHGQHQFSSSKPHNGSTDNNTNSANTISNIGGPTAIALATSVHELLESAVCTNSMYPPIHQCHNARTLCSTCKPEYITRAPLVDKNLVILDV